MGCIRNLCDAIDDFVEAPRERRLSRIAWKIALEEGRAFVYRLRSGENMHEKTIEFTDKFIKTGIYEGFEIRSGENSVRMWCEGYVRCETW